MDARLREVEAAIRGLRELIDARFLEQDRRLEIRLGEMEKRIELRFSEQAFRYDGRLADMERRLTVRLGGMMVAAIGAVSALVRLL